MIPRPVQTARRNMWRQLTTNVRQKSPHVALTRAAGSTANNGPPKAVVTSQMKPPSAVGDGSPASSHASTMNGSSNNRRGGGGTAPLALLILSAGTVAGVAAYIKKNPELNPSMIQDNAAWKKLREFVLYTVPPVATPKETILPKNKVDNKVASPPETKMAELVKLRDNKNPTLAVRGTQKTKPLEKDDVGSQKPKNGDEVVLQHEKQLVDVAIPAMEKKVESSTIASTMAEPVQANKEERRQKSSLTDKNSNVEASSGSQHNDQLKSAMESAMAKEKSAIEALVAEGSHFKDKAKEVVVSGDLKVHAQFSHA
jgi:hypothetical protein